jgi:hypothetical protein
MSNYVPPGDKSDGQIIYGADWNAIKNGLASFLNNGNLGNDNFTSDPAQKLANTKVETNPGAHASRHAPGGADELNDLDIGNTGTPVSAHAARHASGGADPMPAASISAAMLQNFLIADTKVAYRRDAERQIANQLALTHNPRPMSYHDFSASTGFPFGNGCVRSGKVYFSAPGYAPDAVVQIDFTVTPHTETVIALGSGDEPGDLLLIGTDIYVLCGGRTIGGGVAGTMLIKKIDINNTVTTLVNLNDAAAPTPNDLEKGTGLILNGDGTQMYLVAARSGSLHHRVLVRVPVNGTAVNILKSDLGAGFRLSRPMYVKRGTTERILVVDGQAASNDVLYRRNLDLTAIDNTTISTNETRNQCVYDGNYLITLNAAATVVKIIDVWDATPFEAGRFSVVGGVSTPDTAGLVEGGAFFDGRAAYFSVRNAAEIHPLILRVPVPDYEHGSVLKVRAATAYSRGFATDGEYLYAIHSNDGTSNARCVKLLL